MLSHKPGARHLTGDNLEVVRAEFSTQSLAVLIGTACYAQTKHAAISWVGNFALVSWSLSMNKLDVREQACPFVKFWKGAIKWYHRFLWSISWAAGTRAWRRPRTGPRRRHRGKERSSTESFGRGFSTLLSPLLTLHKNKPECSPGITFFTSLIYRGRGRCVEQ